MRSTAKWCVLVALVIGRSNIPHANVQSGWLTSWRRMERRTGSDTTSSAEVEELGIGAGHAKYVEAMTSQSYRRQLSKVASYLDALDRAEPAVPVEERVVAALGPKALRLAAERSAGAHPYNVTPEHTADARAALGPGPLLATEQKVFFGIEPDVAQAVARRTLAIYLDLPNYVNNLLRYGFSEHDFAGEGSDRLVDGLAAWGKDDTVAARARAHVDAGADHAVLQVLSTEPPGLPRAAWRRTAEILVASPTG